jgi:penicillin G amidase
MRHKQRIRTVTHFIVSFLVLSSILYIGGIGTTVLPPLGSVLNPATGVWTIAADAHTPENATFHLHGLNTPVQVTFESNGTAHIHALTDHDLFMTIGYLHATFRLFEMDLMRRQSESFLSEILGTSALPSDEFEDELGLTRTAQVEWAQLTPDDPAWQAMMAYTQGVNDRISTDEQSNNLPIMFKILNYRPALWTPMDTLAIQGLITQMLSFSTGTLDYALLVKSLGYQQAMQWFPLIPPNKQHPYDPGPYHQDSITSLSSSQNISPNEYLATIDLLTHIQALPATAIHHLSNSNNWVVDGTKTASGMPMMAGDPHLYQTLPAIWYQIDGDSPHYQFSGVGIPGIPVILIGKNNHISWSMTDTQNQTTLYYMEKTDQQHPHQYFWKGTWRATQQLHYTIPVKGSPSKNLDVELTAHGPIMTVKGQMMAVWWAGAQPSPDISILLHIIQASNYQEFRGALSKLMAPTQNIIYADDQNNIGLISAGFYPQVASGQPWLPLPGTGESDVIGSIPFDDIPQMYNPPDHFLFSANQRMVSADYPYYIGSALDNYDTGYRADAIYQALSKGDHLTMSDMEVLQNDTHDDLAQTIVPRLVNALEEASLHSPIEQTALSLMQNWDGNMAVSSIAATIWYRFWQQYLYDTFHPWWDHDQVPVAQDSGLRLSPTANSRATEVLGEDLQAWTLTDPTNPAFSLPDGTLRTASIVMQQAFGETITALTQERGPHLDTWTWGNVNAREFLSLIQVPSLGYGPRPSSGDFRSINAADIPYVATAGPSWRFIMDWGTHEAVGVYPGGQSENPLSSWYENQITAWWDGNYYPMYSAAQLSSLTGRTIWNLQS